MKIALVTDDIVGNFMGAGGLRFLRIAQYLIGKGNTVTLYCQSSADVKSHENVEIADAERFNAEYGKYDLAITGTLARIGLQGLMKFGKPIVHDLICPFMLENRHSLSHLPYMKRRAWFREFETDFLKLAMRADAFLVASDRQKWFWQGFFEKAEIFDGSTGSLPLFVDLPNGIDTPDPNVDVPKPSETSSLIELLDEDPETKTLITNGGMYGWFTYEPLLDAFARLAKSGCKIRLVLLGARHPSHPEQSERTCFEVKEKSKKLGIDSIVHLHGWLPHSQRFEVLKRATLGVNIHPQGIETEISYRNRLLDFAACETPLITSTGDVVSERMVDAGIAIPIMGLNPSTLYDVMKRSLDAKWGNSYHIACAGFRSEWDWSRVLIGIERAIESVIQANPRPKNTSRRFDVRINLYCVLRTFFRKLRIRR